MPESAGDETKALLTEEEQRWRDRLRAKREEERLRNLIREKSRNKQAAAATSTTTTSTNSVAADSNGESKAEKILDTKSSSEPASNHKKEKNDGTRERHHRHHHHPSSRPFGSGGPPSRPHYHHNTQRSSSPGRHRHRGPPPPRGCPLGSPPRRHDPYYRPPPPPPRGSGRPPPAAAAAPRDADDDDTNNNNTIDPFGRQRRRSLGGGGHRSSRSSRSYSRSRSRSSSNSSHSLSSPLQPEAGNNKRLCRGRSRSPRRSGSSYSSSEGSSRSSNSSDDGSSRSSSSGSSHSSAAGREEEEEEEEQADEPYSKDQRTVFVTQLVMRTTERDLAKFFRSHHLRTNEIILLRDKRTGKHKGSAYVELKKMQDVVAAVNLSGQAPDFQRFPILIKASEAERNYLQQTAPTTNSSSSGITAPLSVAVAAQQMQQQQQLAKKLPPLTDANGKQIQAQKVYVGNLEANLVSHQHLQALFSPFGTLQEIQLQAGKGFAFLQFHDPKEAALAIQTMAGQMLAGRPMKTGWATNQVSIHGIEIVTSHEFPPDAAMRTQNAYHVLAQLTSGAPVVSSAAVPAHLQQPAPAAAAAFQLPGGTSRQPTVADARASLAAAAAAAGGPLSLLRVAPVSFANPAGTAAPTLAAAATITADPTKIGNAEHPTRHVLVHNMFDKDEETEPGWENDIREEFEEECAKYGKIVTVTVVSKEHGGKIFASFDNTDGAKTCASSLAGRWFDKRQLRVEFVGEDEVARVQKEYPPPL